MYAAVADQLNLRGKLAQPVDFKATRKATAQEMRSHPDEFTPFISDNDEHMAGIENKEAGTLNSEQAQQRKSSSDRVLLKDAEPRSILLSTLFELLRCGRADWSVGRSARDPGLITSIPDSGQRGASRHACPQSGRGRIPRRTDLYLVCPANYLYARPAGD